MGRATAELGRLAWALVVQGAVALPVGATGSRIATMSAASSSLAGRGSAGEGLLTVRPSFGQRHT
jgi:hypothetical protein